MNFERGLIFCALRPSRIRETSSNNPLRDVVFESYCKTRVSPLAAAERISSLEIFEEIIRI